MTELVPGRVAVVTGAARGIGLGLAHAFAQRGMRVVIADIDADVLEDARAEVAEDGAEVLAVRTDVSSEDSVFALAAATLERFGDFDVICNNAGIGSHEFSRCWEKPTVEWERMIAVNVWSVVHGIRAFVPHLVEKNSGHVVNTASMAGLTAGLALMADYALAKSGVVGITESLSKDFEARAPGVKATLLCPGFIRTPLALAQVAKFESGRTANEAGPRWSAALEPAQAAATTLHAIEADLLYAVPARDPFPGVHERIDRLLRELGEQYLPLDD